MNDLMLVRFFHSAAGTEARVGLCLEDKIYDVTESLPSVSGWLQGSVGRVQAAIDSLRDLTGSAASYPLADFDNPPSALSPHLLAPVDSQEVWAAGVTYERSREARQEEAADGGDVYARVYVAERPELFFKSPGWRVVGPLAEVGIRKDATWSVPEAELGVVFNPALEVVGFTVGNDMSSRDIEGANPLYLPQAKVYTAACAIGPGITLNAANALPQTSIRISITRGEESMFAGEVNSSKIRRSIAEFADYLGRCYRFPDGVVLLTGTGMVPPSDFTLLEDDVIDIEIEGLGRLHQHGDGRLASNLMRFKDGLQTFVRIARYTIAVSIEEERLA